MHVPIVLERRVQGVAAAAAVAVAVAVAAPVAALPCAAAAPGGILSGVGRGTASAARALH